MENEVVTILMAMQKDLGEMRSDITEISITQKQTLEQAQRTNGRVTKLESRADELEAKDDTSAGAKTVRKTFFASCWDVGKIILAAVVGGVAGRLIK